jgi:hypothetical protein
LNTYEVSYRQTNFTGDFRRREDMKTIDQIIAKQLSSLRQEQRLSLVRRQA